MKIYIFQKYPRIIYHPSVRKLVRQFLKFHNKNCDEVSIHFIDTETISKMHADYFNDASTTDCISFPMDNDAAEDDTIDEFDREFTGTKVKNYKILGEVFVCPETANAYAKKYSLDALKELTLYVVHGLLHLLGYDDLSPKDRKKMRMEEARFLEYTTTHDLWISLKP